ncbi:hypothetical protein JXA32_06200 [Candidatus Sumerlaeota bacterium]|nr:hypothetical protein [Candidatus Sumerlaeota bacterium]
MQDRSRRSANKTAVPVERDGCSACIDAIAYHCEMLRQVYCALVGPGEPEEPSV